MSVLLLSIIASSASGIFIELESSTIGSEPKEFSATLSNSASVSNSVSVPNLQSRQRSGHKAIRMKLRNLFNLNSIKANLKLKQTTTVGQTIDQGSTSHESKLDIGQCSLFQALSSWGRAKNERGKNEGGLRRGAAGEPVRISLTTLFWYSRSCYTL